MQARFVLLGGSGLIGARTRAECRNAGIDVVAPVSRELDLRTPEGSDKLCDLLNDQTVLVVSVRARPNADVCRMALDDVAAAVNVGRALASRRAQKCIFWSSLAVYGDRASNLAITEATPLSPSSPYAIAKVAAERIIQEAADQSRTPLLILRACMIYGPGDETSSYGPSRLVREALLTGRASLIGHGDDLRPYLFVGDAAAINLRLARSAHEGTLNLAPGQSHSCAEVLDLVREVSGATFDVIHEPRPRPRIDLRAVPIRLEAALLSLPLTDLKAGLAETCGAYRRQSQSHTINHG